MSELIGEAGYQGGTQPNRAAAVLKMLRRRIELRMALAAETAGIQAAMIGLSEAENLELLALLDRDAANNDQDIVAVRQEAKHLAAEHAAAAGTKSIQLTLSKVSSRLLSEEIVRRLERGYCPNLTILAEQAIRTAYSQA